MSSTPIKADMTDEQAREILINSCVSTMKKAMNPKADVKLVARCMSQVGKLVEVSSIEPPASKSGAA